VSQILGNNSHGRRGPRIDEIALVAHQRGGKWYARWTCHKNLAFAKRKSEGFGSSSGRSRGPPVLQRLPSEDAERIAGNKMALNVEYILDDGVNSQEPLR
jgi:hypothetical protein